MPTGAPDWTMWTQAITVVGTTPTPSEALTDLAVTELDRLTTSSTTYGTVVSWTVGVGKVGVLSEVEMESDSYSLTRFQLTIAGVVKFTDQVILGPLELTFPDLHLAAGDVVLLEAKSSDGTEVNVDGTIVGKEVG